MLYIRCASQLSNRVVFICCASQLSNGVIFIIPTDTIIFKLAFFQMTCEMSREQVDRAGSELGGWNQE